MTSEELRMTGWIDFSASSEIPIGKNHLKQNFRLACREAVAQTAVVAVCGFSSSPGEKTRTAETAVRATNDAFGLRPKRRGKNVSNVSSVSIRAFRSAIL